MVFSVSHMAPGNTGGKADSGRVGDKALRLRLEPIDAKKEGCRLEFRFGIGGREKLGFGCRF